MPSKTRILLIEDDDADAHILSRMLESDGQSRFRIERSMSIASGLDRLSRGGIDLVLLDLGLPDSFGLATFDRVRLQVPEIPVVVLSGLDDESIGTEAVREGAQDYLVKGNFGSQLLVRALRYAIERHQTQELLRALSLKDELTGLYNRRGFMTLAGQQLKLARRRKHGLLLAFADLDDLKGINDTFGHDAGNQALIESAEALQGTFRDSDIIARLGGDEFVVMLIDVARDSYSELERRLHARAEKLNRERSRPYQLSLSVGMAELDPATPRSLEALLAEADRAMYAAKKGKKEAARKSGQPRN